MVLALGGWYGFSNFEVPIGETSRFFGILLATQRTREVAQLVLMFEPDQWRHELCAARRSFLSDTVRLTVRTNDSDEI